MNDVAIWLDNENSMGIVLNEEMRPVKLEKLVFGYEVRNGTSEYGFDVRLTSKLENIIRQYADGKPTLIFCSS